MDGSQTSPPPRPGEGWQDYLELKQLLRALGDVVRLNLVHALASGGEKKVTDLAVRLGVSQPLVSWNLAVLRRAGLVCTRRHGREVYCSLDMGRFARCEQLLGALIGAREAREAREELGQPVTQATQAPGAPPLKRVMAQSSDAPPGRQRPRAPERSARRRSDADTLRRAPRPSEP